MMADSQQPRVLSGATLLWAEAEMLKVSRVCEDMFTEIGAVAAGFSLGGRI